MIKIRFNKKASAADLIIATSGIILICAAIISVLISRNNMPTETNTAAVEILNTEKTFDALNILTQISVKQAIVSTTPIKSISNSVCDEPNYDVDLILTDANLPEFKKKYLIISKFCKKTQIQDIFTQTISKQIDTILLNQDQQRLALTTNNNNNWLSDLNFDKNANLFFADQFQVSLETTEPMATKVIVISKKPFTHSKSIVDFWSIDAKRDFFLKGTLPKSTQYELELLNYVPQINELATEIIVKYENEITQSREKGTQPPTHQDLFNRINAALNDKTKFPQLDQESATAQGFFKIGITNKNVIIIFPQKNVATILDLI